MADRVSTKTLSDLVVDRQPDRLTLLLEAERRGIAIDEADRALLAEARRRGLVLGGEPTASEPRTSGGGVMDFVRQAAGALDPMGEMVTSRLAGERPRLEGAATAARMLPGVAVANPLAAGALSVAGEAAAQGFEQEMGDRTRYSPLELGVAGAAPPAVAGVVRTVRAGARTATRVIPSRFARAQGEATAAAEDVARTVAPEANATQLFKAARGTGETVPAGRISKILDDLDDTIDPDPTDAGLQQVRAFSEKLRGKIAADGSISLDDLLKQRHDLGRMIQRRGSAPELRAIYGHGGDDAKGLIGALEEAIAAGGQGATAARQALDVFKRDLGVVKWKELVEQASSRTNISGVDTPTLNIAKLGNLVEKNADELTRQLGDDGLKVIRGYLTRFKTLPPTHAANAATALLAIMAGSGAGFATGSLPVAAGAVLAPEILRNVFAVGKNPAQLNRLMTGLAQATRTGLTVAVGPEARELSRRR